MIFIKRDDFWDDFFKKIHTLRFLIHGGHAQQMQGHVLKIPCINDFMYSEQYSFDKESI